MGFRRPDRGRDRLLIGLDSGTQSCSASIFTPSGGLVRRAVRAQPVHTPREGWAEQDSRCWGPNAVGALRAATAGIEPGRFLALGIAFQRETFALLDAKGNPLRPAILWLDIRADAQAQALGRRLGAARFRRLTGKQLDATCALPRLLWLRKHQPGTASQNARFEDVGAALSAELTGRHATCVAGADTCGLVGLNTRDWIEDFLDLARMKRRQFPDLVEPGEEIGRLSAPAARRTGLPSGLPVIAGAGDGQAFSIGAGVIEPFSIGLTLGTSIVLGVNSRKPHISSKHRTLLLRPGSYLLESVLQSGTYLLKWFQNFLGNDLCQRGWERKAARLPPGSQGLLTLPHWWGSRFPDLQPDLRGLTMGWGHRQTPAHFYRSLLEGSAFELRRAIQEFARIMPGTRSRRVAVGGGGAASRLWLNILADILDRPLVPAGESQTAARGAAMLAGLGIGLFEDIRAAADAMCVLPAAIRPQRRRARTYEMIYRQVYCPLLGATARTNRRLRALALKRSGNLADGTGL